MVFLPNLTTKAYFKAKIYIFLTFMLCVDQLKTTLQSLTGPVQGFPCVVFPHREKSVFITGFPGDVNRFFPVRITTQRKPCFHYRDGFAVWDKNLEIYTLPL